MDDKKKLVAVNVLMWLAQGAYAVSPIDLLPDFIPLIGLADDALGLMMTLGFTAYTLYRLYNDKSAPVRTTRDVIDYEPIPLDQLKAL